MNRRNRRYKILIIVLALCCAALVAASVWLYLRTPKVGGSSPAAEAETEPPAEALSSESEGKIVINEFMEKNRAVLRDEDGDFSDWIELRNVSDEAVELTGWTIADEATGGWAIPQTSLGAGEYLLIFASGKDKSGGELHADFSVSGDETLYLRDASGALVDSAACLDCGSDVASVRGEDGSWEQSLYPTPGFENSTAGYIGFQSVSAAAGPLVINEAMVSNQNTYYDAYRGYCDWVEIKNISSEAVQLSDYCLSDKHDNYTLWSLPDVSLGAGKTLVILCDGEEGVTPNGVYCAPFSLSDDGEQLYLSTASGELIDWISLRDIPCGDSYGRMDGLNGWFFFAEPTPGLNNSGGCRYVASMPEGLTRSGIYDDVRSVEVELSAAEGQKIYYTLDGSLPSERSLEYTGPISLTETTVLRAVAVEEGAIQSRALTQSFIINEAHTLPVLSLATDSVSDFESMYWNKQKNLELPASLSLYEQDGSSFTIGCGVSMNGETSLDLNKKNMSVRFRGAYGDDTLNYDIYGGGVTEFTNLLLRSGQDYNYAIVRNELCQELCADAGMDVINQRSIWCVLYINGEYSGIYTLKEKENEAMYAAIAGVSRDSVTVYEANAPYNSDLVQDVIQYCVMNDMSLDENYEHICSLIDIDSVIDWTIMESFCANTDLLSGNLRYCRSTENDGKWRLMFYDLDATFRSAEAMYGTLLSDYAYETQQVSKMLVPLMDNAEYRDRFLSRAAELLSGPLSNEAVIAALDEQAAIIADEVERDYSRYGMSYSSWEWNLQYIRDIVNNWNWRQLNIDALCNYFNVSSAERAEYFGEIDGK